MEFYIEMKELYITLNCSFIIRSFTFTQFLLPL